MNRNFFFFLALIGCSFLISFKWNSKTNFQKTQSVSILDPECSDTVSFKEDIMPLFENHCNDCHGEQSGTGYSFHEYSVIAYHAPEALAAMQRTGWGAMPLDNPPVPDSIISLLECWIGSGRPNN